MRKPVIFIGGIPDDQYPKYVAHVQTSLILGHNPSVFLRWDKTPDHTYLFHTEYLDVYMVMEDDTTAAKLCASHIDFMCDDITVGDAIELIVKLEREYQSHWAEETVKNMPSINELYLATLFVTERYKIKDQCQELRQQIKDCKKALNILYGEQVMSESKIETCRERLKREHPEKINPDTLGGCVGCPDEYGYVGTPDFCHDGSVDDETACTKCWDRPVDESPVRSGDQSWGAVKPKYEFTDETRAYCGRTLHRIRAARDIYFPSGRLFVKKGELGGWIEHAGNLSHDGSCWVGEEACVLQNAAVGENAYVSGHAIVRNTARVGQEAQVSEFAIVVGDTRVYGGAYVHGYACVYGNAQVWSNAEICDEAAVGGNAMVFRHAKICGKAHITIPGLYREVTLK